MKKSYSLNIRIKTIFLIFFIVLLNINSQSQNLTDSIDSEKVYQKRKKKFINNKYLSGAVSFNDLTPTCINIKDSLKYSYQYDTYIVKDNPEKVWNKYKSISLPDSYTGHIVSFGFMYSKQKNKLVYVDDEDYKGMKEGQVFFINLNLLAGLKKLVVAYEVTQIDNENKTIQFCYIDNGVSEGTQKIILSNTEEGYTKIQHNTIYKSQSKIRDKYIYPRFHRKIVKELHKNLIITL